MDQATEHAIDGKSICISFETKLLFTLCCLAYLRKSINVIYVEEEQDVEQNLIR